MCLGFLSAGTPQAVDNFTFLGLRRRYILTRGNLCHLDRALIRLLPSALITFVNPNSLSSEAYILVIRYIGSGT